MNRLSILAVSLVLPILVLGAAISSGSPQSTSSLQQTRPNLASEKVWFVAGTNQLFNQVLSKLRNLGVPQVNQIDPASIDVNTSSVSGLLDSPPSLVIFDGDWMSAHFQDSQTLRFLKVVAFGGHQLVAIGGSTSFLLLALNSAGVNQLGENSNGSLRNPAYFNPSVAGFRFKNSDTTLGYSYPSILISNNVDSTAIIQALNNWI